MKKKNAPKKSIRRRKSPAPRIFAALAVLLCVFFGWMGLQARVVHLQSAQVRIADLPTAFEGARILYISDFKIKSRSDAEAAVRLMKRLAELRPDLLLLGGDYSSRSAFEALNGASDDHLSSHTADFIASLADFPAPMGKFAVAGDSDGDLQALAAAFEASGVACLADSSVKITLDGANLHIAGLSDGSFALSGGSLGRNFSRGDCVIVLSHNPSGYGDVRVGEAGDGGAWADLVLAGHNLGGQINAFGRTLRRFSDTELRTMSGWFYPNDLPLLVSQGLGSEFANLRLGSQSQVHLIELRSQG